MIRTDVEGMGPPRWTITVEGEVYAVLRWTDRLEVSYLSPRALAEDFRGQLSRPRASFDVFRYETLPESCRDRFTTDRWVFAWVSERGGLDAAKASYVVEGVDWTELLGEPIPGVLH